MKLHEYISGLDCKCLIIPRAVKQYLNDEIDLERTCFPVDSNRSTNIIFLEKLSAPLVIGFAKGKPCFISLTTPAFVRNHPELFHHKDITSI